LVFFSFFFFSWVCSFLRAPLCPNWGGGEHGQVVTGFFGFCCCVFPLYLLGWGCTLVGCFFWGSAPPQPTTPFFLGFFFFSLGVSGPPPHQPQLGVKTQNVFTLFPQGVQPFYPAHNPPPFLGGFYHSPPVSLVVIQIFFFWWVVPQHHILGLGRVFFFDFLGLVFSSPNPSTVFRVGKGFFGFFGWFLERWFHLFFTRVLFFPWLCVTHPPLLPQNPSAPKHGEAHPSTPRPVVCIFPPSPPPQLGCGLFFGYCGPPNLSSPPPPHSSLTFPFPPTPFSTHYPGGGFVHASFLSPLFPGTPRSLIFFYRGGPPPPRPVPLSVCPFSPNCGTFFLLTPTTQTTRPLFS